MGRSPDGWRDRHSDGAELPSNLYRWGTAGRLTQAARIFCATRAAMERSALLLRTPATSARRGVPHARRGASNLARMPRPQWALHRERIGLDARLNTGPGHRGRNWKAFACTGGIGSYRGGAAPVAQIVKEDATATFCVRRQNVFVGKSKAEIGDETVRNRMG